MGRRLFALFDHQRGGFDAIITNPPWEAVEPKAKEFFVVAKNATDIKDFEAGLAVPNFEGYIGKNLGTAELCKMLGTCAAKYAKKG